MKKNFILASVVSLTLMGVAPTVFSADQKDSRQQIRDENKVSYSEVPGDVKRAIEPNLNSGDKVTDVYKYNRGGRTVYVAYTNDERVIRADDRGNLLSVKSTDDEADAGNRTAVKYNSLPGEVKDTLGKEAKGHPMEIYKVSQNGKTNYVAYIDDSEGTHRVRVNNNGDIVDRPVLLSDTGNTRDRNSRDDIDARRREDRARYNSDGEKLTFENLPGQVKQTVGEEMGRDKVTDVLKVRKNGKTMYRVEIEGADRAKTIWVDENGKLDKELNDTEEGRQRVNYNELPGNVKSAMINEAHGQQPSRVWQVTRGRDTTYVGEATDGHLVRIDSDGRVISHDANPKLLDNTDTRNRNVDERNRNNNSSSNDDKRFEKDRALDLSKADKVEFGNLPNDVKDTIRQETKSGEKISDIYKVKTDNGTIHYIVKTNDGRTIRVGEHGGLLGQTR
jgi:hypothetical protein